jgi:DNA polymerase
MRKEFLEFTCTKECPYTSTCCRLPTEVIKHEGREGIDILIFGQGAGKDEAKIGRCFVGRSGKYMRSIIKSLWDNPEVGPFNIALTNNVRFRPEDENGKDRMPTAEEISRCITHLHRDIAQLNPKVIVPVGKNATLSILNTSPTFLNVSIATMISLRGNVFTNTNGIKRTVIPTWHPSFLCRQYGGFDPTKNNKYDKEFIADILKALEC